MLDHALVRVHQERVVLATRGEQPAVENERLGVEVRERHLLDDGAISVVDRVGEHATRHITRRAVIAFVNAKVCPGLPRPVDVHREIFPARLGHVNEQ